MICITENKLPVFVQFGSSRTDYCSLLLEDRDSYFTVKKNLDGERSKESTPGQEIYPGTKFLATMRQCRHGSSDGELLSTWVNVASIGTESNPNGLSPAMTFLSLMPLTNTPFIPSSSSTGF
jgi:hypothetical protein